MAVVLATPRSATAQRIAPAGVVRLQSMEGLVLHTSDDDITPRQRTRRFLWGVASGATLGLVFAHTFANSPLVAPDDRSHAFTFCFTGTTIGITALSWWGLWPCPGDC